MTATRTLLFVDDDRDFLDGKRAFFEARGHTVLTAESSAEALALLATTVPDVIFLDLMMDRVDEGFRLAYVIRRMDRLAGVPLVMLSGVAAATGRRFDREGGGLHEWTRLDKFLDKPVTGGQLLRIVEQLGDDRATA